jgi:hypothetical protein
VPLHRSNTRADFVLAVPDGEDPLYARIATAIVADVRRGRLRPGDALPGSRTLAETLGVQRNPPEPIPLPIDRAEAAGIRAPGSLEAWMLDPKLVASLRAVAARTDIAQRVLTILEPGQGPEPPAAAGRRGR